MEPIRVEISLILQGVNVPVVQVVQRQGGDSMPRVKAAALSDIRTSVWDTTVQKYLTWGRAFGGRKGHPWATAHAELLKGPGLFEEEKKDAT